MSVPFLKADKSGVSVRFPKALYLAQSLPQLRDMFPGRSLVSSNDKRYFTLSLKGGSEEDGLSLCEKLLYVSRQPGKG